MKAALPEPAYPVRGKKIAPPQAPTSVPISTQLRMEPRLEKARKFLQGEFVAYQCPHKNKRVAVNLHCVALMIQGDGPMLEELMFAMGHACPRAFVEAELESVAGSQSRRLVPHCQAAPTTRPASTPLCPGRRSHSRCATRT